MDRAQERAPERLLARTAVGATMVDQQIARDHEQPRGDAGATPDLGLAPDLERALATLSAREREIIALRFGGELTGPEIAETTGLSLANVQQILSRSLRRMRAVLDEKQPDSAGGETSPG